MSKHKFGYTIDDRELERVNKICIIAWGLIGDVFIRVPLVEAVRRRFPDAEITVIVESLTQPLFVHNPAVDRVLVLNRSRKPLLKYIAAMLKTIPELRRNKYDLCIDLYMGGSSPNITRLSRARIRLGFDHMPKLKKSYNLLVKKPGFCRQWILDLGKILSPLGITDSDIRVGTSFQYAEHDRSAVSGYFPTGKQCFCINLGARDPAKCWPIDKFVALAERINHQYGYIPLVLTNPGQENLAREFMRQYDGEAINPPVLPLGQVGALMDGCLLTITGDTSLMHMSFGLHKPTLVLFTYTRPEWHVVEDCRLEYCFHENPQAENTRCNMPWGDKHISIEQAYNGAAKLIADIAH